MPWCDLSKSASLKGCPGENFDSACLCSNSSHRTIHAVVENLCAGRHVRLQDLHGMTSAGFGNRVLGILQVRKLTRACRADLAAGGGQALGNAVITERALLGGVGSGIDKAAAVRAGLRAI